VWGVIVGVAMFAVFSAAAGDAVRIKELTQGYFENAFSVDRADVRVKFIHIPEIPNSTFVRCRWAVESERPVPRLGYQTLWVKVFDGGELVHRAPLTVDVAVRVEVAAAAKAIRRGETVTLEKVVFREIIAGSDFGELIREPGDIVGLTARCAIAPGEVIYRRMLRPPPAVSKGDPVTVVVRSGNGVTVTASGTAGQDGMIGDRVKVVCGFTDKPVVGTVRSAGVVVVEVK